MSNALNLEIEATSATTASVPSHWRWARQFVLRMTGFGFELLEGLAFHQTVIALAGEPAVEDVKSCFEAELLEKRRLLWETARQSRFLEALLLSNPEIFARVESYLSKPFPAVPNSAQARVERVLATYLQRFCAKNDSSSFFGPVVYGAVDDLLSSCVAASPAGRLAERKVRLAHWAAEAICQGLTGEESALPAQTWDPIACVPEAASHRDVAELQLLVNRFATADLAGRKSLLSGINSLFQQISGDAAYRNPGQPYGDRMVITEECRYDAGDLRMASSALQRLSDDAASFFDLVTYPDRLKMMLERAAFAKLFAQVWGRDASVPYEQVMFYLSQHPDEAEAARERARDDWKQLVAQWLTAIHQLIEGHEDEPVCELSSEMLSKIKAAACSDLDPWPHFFSPDFLLASSSLQAIENDDYQWVLGEIHQSFGINGYYAQVHPDKAGLRGELTSSIRHLSGERQPVQFVTRAYNKTFSDLDLPFPVLEYGGRALPGSDVLHWPDLVIQIGANSIELRHKSLSKPLFLLSKMPWVLQLYPLCLFGVAPSGMQHFKHALTFKRNHLPRIQLGRLTVLRETWKMSRAELAELISGDRLQAFCNLQKYGQQQNWPRFIFVRIDEAEKPVFVDLHNWFLIDALKHRLNKSCAATVEVSELLPDAAGLWLKDVHGSHTSEFRLTCYLANQQRRTA